jgi:signal transduction histidine kinase
MQDMFILPALVLTVLLLPVLVYVHRRYGDTRSLLWMLGLLCAVARLVQNELTAQNGPWAKPWIAAAGLAAAVVSAVLFMYSLSPVAFRVGGRRIPYAVPFVLPLLLYAVLLHVGFNGDPSGLPFLLFPGLGSLSLLVGAFWGYSKGRMPTWLGLGLCVVFGGTALSLCVSAGGDWPLVFTQCSLYMVTALLVVFVYHRWTPGTVLFALGLLLSADIAAIPLHPVVTRPELQLLLIRGSVLGVAILAVGCVLLSFESQVIEQEGAQERERHARNELEAYTRLTLGRRRLDDFDRQATQLCQTVVAQSRFAQVALLLLNGTGKFSLAGAAGIDDATFSALESLVARISVTDFLAPGTAYPAVGNCQTYHLSMGPWLLPGDDLKRLGLTAALATPLYSRSGTDGAFILSAPRNPEEPIRAEDLLPIEVLAARVQAGRSQTMMLEKLIDAEKFAGLGQLATNVTRQLNNPLTVILGYASLISETQDLNPQIRRAVDAILAESRTMRKTLESLSRMSRTQTEHFAAISVTELLMDMEQLHRSEFVHRGIDFRFHVAPALPRVLGNSQQVRQAVLYCLQFAIETVENMDSDEERTVRMDATSHGEFVQIRIVHNGPGFLYPARAFEPFVPAQASSETAGLGLSLCATILRENNGRISAENFEPRGAAIVLELQAA